MSKIELQRPIIIAGPCAAESEEIVFDSAKSAKERGVEAVRLSLWKPRTRHPEGVFMGVGLEGIPWLVEVAKMGLIPATEVLTKEHAVKTIEAIEEERELRGRERLLLWLGSRNQNDTIQIEIGRIVGEKPWVFLMIKNQMWEDENHWIGISEAVLTGGAKKEQLLLCHRGFFPGRNGLRNSPNFDMAMRVRKETGLPMLIDPSHMGGSVENVLVITKQAMEFEENGEKFDGFIVEVHPNPPVALTDRDQQLTWEQFDELFGEVEV